jgi:hypothetical protein
VRCGFAIASVVAGVRCRSVAYVGGSNQCSFVLMIFGESVLSGGSMESAVVA